MTGGGSRLKGVLELSKQFFGVNIRIGNHVNILKGAPQYLGEPCFSASLGLLRYPYFLDQEYVPYHSNFSGISDIPKRSDGYIWRVGKWVKENF